MVFATPLPSSPLLTSLNPQFLPTLLCFAPHAFQRLRPSVPHLVGTAVPVFTLLQALESPFLFFSGAKKVEWSSGASTRPLTSILKVPVLCERKRGVLAAGHLPFSLIFDLIVSSCCIWVFSPSEFRYGLLLQANLKQIDHPFFTLSDGKKKIQISDTTALRSSLHSNRPPVYLYVRVASKQCFSDKEKAFPFGVLISTLANWLSFVAVDAYCRVWSSTCVATEMDEDLDQAQIVKIDGGGTVILDIERLVLSSDKCSGSPKMTKALSRKGSSRMEKRNGDDLEMDEPSKLLGTKVVCSQSDHLKQFSASSKALLTVTSTGNSPSLIEGADTRTKRLHRLSAINPRRILLFFATMSSMGTLIIIYFTLAINRRGGS